MYYNNEAEKKERRKIIAIVAVTMILILLLIASIVVVATSKTARKNVGGVENSSFSISIDNEAEEKTEEEVEEKNDEDIKKDTAGETSVVGTISTKTAEPAESATTVSNTISSLPSTGPEDLLPFAIILGLLTTGTTAFAMSRREA